MKSNNILKSAMTTIGYRQVDLANALKLKSQARISAMLKSDMQCSTFARAMNVMGYTVTISGHGKEWILDGDVTDD